MNEVSERIKQLRDNFIDTIPEITADRVRLITESYRLNQHVPYCLKRARMFSHLLENMDIYIQPGELIVGSMTGKLRGVPVFPEYDASFILKELDSFYDRSADRFYVEEETKAELRSILPQWMNISLSDIAKQKIPPESLQAATDCVFILTALGSGVGHVIVDYEYVLQHGMKSHIRNLERLCSNTSNNQEKKEYYEASITTCQAIVKLACRYAELAQEMSESEPDKNIKAELIKIANICRKVPYEPAGDFHEALQSLWFLHLGIQLEGNGHSISLGRFDQYLNSYYVTFDDKALAEELIHCLWLKFSEINKIRDEVSSVAFGGYPMFQNITLGGQTAKGTSAVNELTSLCLEATAKVGMHQPSISFRWFLGCSEKHFQHALEIAAYGTGMPAFFNDEVLVPNMLQAGYSLEQARNYAIVGCTETSVGGISEPWLTGGFINLLKILELTINNGCDPISGDVFSMKTGDVESFSCFEEFFNAYLMQLAHYLSVHVECNNMLDILHGELTPNIFVSTMIQDCQQQGRSSMQGGARFNSTTINAVGIANVADSLAVIKKLVYEDRKLSWTELKQALLDNFENHEALRQTILNHVPKYGNDEAYVDLLAQQVHEFLYEEFKKYKNPRGGRYFNALYSIACHVLFADRVGATPDGRKKGMVLADGGVSCSQGRDIKGPTAMLNSVVKLDPYKAIGSTLLNMKFHPDIFFKSNNLNKISALLKSYFMMKGQHIQLNVVDVQTLREAQKNPEKYASLVVRVAGFSVLFTTINAQLQEDIILRTENCSGG